MARPSILPLVFSITCALIMAAEAFVPEMAPPPNPKHQKPMKERQLEQLFGALKASPEPQLSHALAARILKIWNEPESDTVKILVQRVQEAQKQNDQKTARDFIDSIIEIDPRYFQARHERSKIHFQNNDLHAAMVDLREVLRREPRHFDALVGVGMILMATGDDERAFLALQAALSIHPHLPSIGSVMRNLEDKIQGSRL